LREPGVLILPSNSSSTDAIHVPESVVERVYRRITNAGHAAVSSPSEDKGYDVFLAHNSNDKSHVEAIGKQLRRRRLHPWLDKWYIPPGRMFQKEIEHALSSSKSIAIFIGSNGLGRWETMEMRSAISQFVDREAPVIPVLLPGIEHPELPPFMREFAWVKFKCLNDPEAIENLVWGIKGQVQQS